MKDYYKTLGLEYGASAADIKKAYFRLVRLHTPEEEPERFKEIREAYEFLKDERNRAEQPEEVPEEPFARRMLEQIRQCIRSGIYWRGADTALEAHRLYPGETIFLYYLAFCERKADYTGKAVKHCQELLLKEPDNFRYRREMALAYAARGYRKKALEAFGQAYSRDCRDLEFIVEYSRCCVDSRELHTLAEILQAIHDGDIRWKPEEIPLLLTTYELRFQLAGLSDSVQERLELLKQFSAFVHRYVSALEDDCEELQDVLVDVAGGYSDIWKEARSHMEDICRVLDENFHSEFGHEMADDIKTFVAGVAVLEDDRLGETLKFGWKACFAQALPEDENERRFFLRYGELDLQLCILKEWPDILKEIELLKEISPEYYNKLKEFVDLIQSTSNRSYLKNKLLKEYQHLSEFMNGGRYFECYPSEKRSGAVVWEAETPYVRTGKKIGRNDPCPCGSGKKYKQCCGKNANGS